ncbi:Bax inhibitor-1/YccA family protein [Lawsonella clevelandensis]|uniref:Bax inhibitor-1/YccA family protein n=1 Tax=Lawsonella clevelandensis TaxID=1528099 RepID=UPI0023EFC4A8|nr:Bax inhibitor-1/YccA family protein [Lawsonella clevelandensis]
MAFRSSNPVLGALNRQGNTAGGYQQHYGQQQYEQQQGQNPYAQFGQAQAGFAQGASYFGQQQVQQEFQQYAQAPGQMPLQTTVRAITIDDVVTKTGITLGVIIVSAIISFIVALRSPVAGMGLLLVGAIASLIIVLIATFGKKMQSAPITISYAVFEGLWVGAFSQIVAGVDVAGSPAMGIIFGALAGTIGVFVGMLVVYRTGAIRVTPKFTRILIGCIFGILAVVVVNLLASLIAGRPDFFGLYSGGPIAIVFSLVCIVLAALSFLSDFDSVDHAVRAGVPAGYAWGLVLGLAVTLVWLYTEILRLLSYFRD